MILYELNTDKRIVNPKIVLDAEAESLGQLNGLGFLFRYKDELYFRPENVAVSFSNSAVKVETSGKEKELFVGLFDPSPEARICKFSPEEFIGLVLLTHNDGYKFILSQDLSYEGTLPNFGTFYSAHNRVIFIPFGRSAQAPEFNDFAFEVDDDWLEHYSLSIEVVRANK